MNESLSVKMSKIESHFNAAGVKMPTADRRYDVTPVKCGSSKGAQVGNTAVWGVTCREYWAYLKGVK